MGAGDGYARSNFVPIGNQVIDVRARIREPRQNDLHLLLHVLATSLGAIPAVPTNPVGGIEAIDRCQPFVIFGVYSAANERLILFRHRTPSNHKRPDDPVLDLCSGTVKERRRPCGWRARLPPLPLNGAPAEAILPPRPCARY